MTTTRAFLGPVIAREDIRSTLAPFHVLEGYRTTYPDIVVRALGNLYAEYNRAFGPLVAANREWETDYQYGAVGGVTTNYAVQIDMVGLTPSFLEAAPGMPLADVEALLRGRVFELENSLAMYQLLERICAFHGRDSFFKPRFRATLDALRHRFHKPIALLAVTDQKYAAMMESEFGRSAGDWMTDDEVRELSGFDHFFGPDEFRDHVASRRGACDYLLFARTSDPVAVLKKPGTPIDHPLLGNPEMRRVIKAHAVTFNVDSPDWPARDIRRINDTKRYMPPMKMAFPVADEGDYLTREFLEYVSKGKPGRPPFTGPRLKPAFVEYLRIHRVDPEAVANGQTVIRGKPVQGTYGCYGHVSGTITDGQFRGELRRNLRTRGDYILQPEMAPPSLVNEDDGSTFNYIDRNFFGLDASGQPVFLGGFRSLLPVDSVESQKGRIHGNGDTVWAEIVSNE